MDNSKSLETSRGNANKLPSLLKYITDKGYKKVLNYGCGLYGEKHRGMMKEYGVTLVNFDKYIQWLSNIENIDMNTIECIVCSNVLNVIPRKDEIVEILDFFVKSNKDVYISIYEGSRSNKLNLNSNGYWQRNETRKVFFDKFLKQYGFIREKEFFYLKGGKNGN